MRLPAWLVATFACSVFSGEAGSLIVAESPDGNFGVQVTVDGDGGMSGMEVVHLPSRAVAADLSEDFLGSAHAVWAPDSSKVALSGRAGVRYETAVVYLRDGDRLIELPTPEQATSAALQKAMEAARREQQVPEGASIRRIWDKWELRRWLDDTTAEVLACSVRAADVDGEDAGSISVALRFTLRLREGETWEILSEEEVAESEVLGD